MTSVGEAPSDYERAATQFDDGLDAEQNDDAPLPTHLSEDAMALVWANRHSTKYKYTTGMDWHVDVGDRWIKDDKLTRYDLSRQVCREFSTMCEQQHLARAISSAKTINNVLSIARTDKRCALEATAWDADIYALNTPDGIVDLRTGNLRPRAGDFVTQVTRVSPDPTMPSPMWRQFLDDVFEQDEDMISFWQRMIGYFLTGSVEEQKIFFCWGKGGNGKSKLVETIEAAIGSYSVRMPAEALMQSKHDRHPTEIAMLKGKRLAISSELEEGEFWSESKIKALTGDTVMQARFMRGDFFSFNQSQKHLVVGNYRPRMRGGDVALGRRMVLIPFTAEFAGERRDKQIGEKLWTEAPAILSWAIQGAVMWRNDGGLRMPEKISSASEDYMSSNDDMLLWIEECCELAPDATSKASDLYESFSTWLRARGQHSPSMRIWGDRMATMPKFPKKHSAGVRYTGLRLTAAERARIEDLQPTRRLF